MALIISEATTIVYPTDFYIEVGSITDRDGMALELETAPFYFEFFGAAEYAKVQACTALSDTEKYVVSFDGTERVNNIYEDGVLKFKFENYPICSGKVCYKQVESYANTDFEDNSEDIVTVLKTNITIKAVGSNSMSSDSAISTTVTLGALRGTDGVTFTPSVTTAGDLSWDNDGGLENPDAVNLKGNKGDQGEPFAIYKTFESVALMEADDSVPEGKFVIIATGNVEIEDNAKLYVRTADGYSFITDLSGAQGIKGDALTYEDLTEAQIAELQKPATDITLVVSLAEESRVEAEESRVLAEQSRVEAEESRVTEEQSRVTAETTRTAAEDARVSNETARVEAEAQRVTSETARAAAENLRVSAETARVSSENTRVSNESTRVSAESTRVSAEAIRVSNETARVSAESARATAEAARQSAEADRIVLYNTVDTKIAETIKYTEQTLTEEQQEQARVNIGVIDYNSVENPHIRPQVSIISAPTSVLNDVNATYSASTFLTFPQECDGDYFVMSQYMYRCRGEKIIWKSSSVISCLTYHFYPVCSLPIIVVNDVVYFCRKNSTSTILFKFDYNTGEILSQEEIINPNNSCVQNTAKAQLFNDGDNVYFAFIDAYQTLCIYKIDQETVSLVFSETEVTLFKVARNASADNFLRLFIVTTTGYSHYDLAFNLLYSFDDTDTIIYSNITCICDGCWYNGDGFVMVTSDNKIINWRDYVGTHNTGTLYSEASGSEICCIYRVEDNWVGFGNNYAVFYSGGGAVGTTFLSYQLLQLVYISTTITLLNGYPYYNTKTKTLYNMCSTTEASAVYKTQKQ